MCRRAAPRFGSSRTRGPKGANHLPGIVVSRQAVRGRGEAPVKKVLHQKVVSLTKETSKPWLGE